MKSELEFYQDKFLRGFPIHPGYEVEKAFEAGWNARKNRLGLYWIQLEEAIYDWLNYNAITPEEEQVTLSDWLDSIKKEYEITKR
jgi:hypothetical protein